MTTSNREGQLLETFATLADTLVDQFDIVELLQTLVEACRDLLDITDAGILLANPEGDLELVASTSEATRLVEVMQLAAESGPCIECFHTGLPVSVPDVGAEDVRWPAFNAIARANGFDAVDAIPMRLRDRTIGTLNLLRSEPGSPSPSDLIAARAFADVATIGILHERAVREAATLTDQLQTALNSRVVIEQAKGVISHTAGVPMDEAFSILRSYARARGRPLSETARQVVQRELRFDTPHR